jgi:hypothetical protein
MINFRIVKTYHAIVGDCGYAILPPFLDIRYIVFCKKFQNIRCMARLWDFFYTI